MDNRRIGVYDSGVGGLTVLREMEQILPSEDLLYFGDSKNRPYGYQTEERLMYLITNVLDDFASKDVKAVALACNTISVLADRLEGKYPFPVFSIIQAAVNYVLKNHDCTYNAFFDAGCRPSGLYPYGKSQRMPGA